jgi:hypothetical protein
MDTILRISDAANLAIHAMAHIARSKGNVNHSVGEIAGEQGVSVAHLSKVMQRLVKVGLLTSRRGPGGGFRSWAGGREDLAARNPGSHGRPHVGLQVLARAQEVPVRGLRAGGAADPREPPGPRVHGLAQPHRSHGCLAQAHLYLAGLGAKDAGGEKPKRARKAKA